MRKLTEAQANALTAIHLAKAFTTGGYKVRPDSVRPNTQAALLRAGLVETYRVDSADLVRLTEAGTEALSAPEPVDTWPADVVSDGSVIALADFSDQQIEALTDVATVAWTPAHRHTVESLIRHGLVAWVPATTDPAEFKLTEEGARAYKALTVATVVPNRADRRRNRAVPVHHVPTRKARPSTVAVKALKPGERFYDRLGRTVTVAAHFEHGGPGLSILVRTAEGEDVRAVFTERKARVTLSNDSPRVRYTSRYRLFRPGSGSKVVISQEELTPVPFESMELGDYPAYGPIRGGWPPVATVAGAR